MKRLRELPVSKTVGDAYRLARRLGKGAFGTVYEASDLRVPAGGDRRCAIKVMNGAMFDAPEAMARFHSQAETASRLAHPHLVRVRDFGTTDPGEPFLVMDLHRGEDLGKRLRRVGRLDPPLVGHLIKQAASALAILHRQGVAHLDLKPSNILLLSMVGEPDFVKLMDFGTTQVENARTLDHATRVQDSLPYVAPEQIGGGPQPAPLPDARADQWALACIAWHMLVGRPPFAGEDDVSLLYQIAFEDPAPVGARGEQLPPGTLQVLAQALDKRPDNRFADVTELARALEAVTGPLPVVERPPAPAFAPEPAGGPAAVPAGAPDAAAPAWPAARRPESVFLPGMSRREAAPPRKGGPTRMTGLRVRARAADEAGPAATESAAGPEASPAAAASPLADAPAAVPGPWATLRAQLTTRTGRRWLLVGGLPALLLTAFVVGRPHRRVVDPERERTTPASPRPPAAVSPPRAQIMPIITPRPRTGLALKGRRRTRRGGKARTADLRTSSRRR